MIALVFAISLVGTQDSHVFRIVDRESGRPIDGAIVQHRPWHLSAHPGDVTLGDIAWNDLGGGRYRLEGWPLDPDDQGLAAEVLISAKGYSWKVVAVDEQRTPQLVTLNVGASLDITWTVDLPHEQEPMLRVSRELGKLGLLGHSGYYYFEPIERGRKRIRLNRVEPGSYSAYILPWPALELLAGTSPGDGITLAAGENRELALRSPEKLQKRLEGEASQLEQLESDPPPTSANNRPTARVEPQLICDGRPVVMPRAFEWSRILGIERDQWDGGCRTRPYTLTSTVGGELEVEFYDFGEYVFDRRQKIEFVIGETRQVRIDATLRWPDKN